MKDFKFILLLIMEKRKKKKIVPFETFLTIEARLVNGGHSSCKITVKNFCHDVYLSWSPCELNETLHLRSATSLSQSWVRHEVDVFKTTWVPEERGTPVPRTATVLSSYVHTRLGRTVHKSFTDNTFLQLFTQLQLLNKYYFQKSSHAA